MREPEVPAPNEGETMTEQAQQYTSLPWIPDDEKRKKYEEKDDRVAAGGQQIEGIVTGHGTRDRFDKKGKYNVVTITTDDGAEIAIHCQPTVLENQMLEALPKYGERITVTFLGVKQGANFSTPYANYSVRVHREAGGEIAWAARGEPDQPVHVVYEQPAPQPVAVQTETAPAAASDDDIPF